MQNTQFVPKSTGLIHNPYSPPSRPVIGWMHSLYPELRKDEEKSTPLLLYRSLVRPKLDFGSIVKSLDIIHNNAIRLALGTYGTTPVQSLYSEAGEPSLQIRRHILSLSHAATVSANERESSYENTFTTRYLTHHRTKPLYNRPFCGRIRMMIENLNISFLEIHPDIVDHPPPWSVKIPSCNRSLTIYDKSNKNPNVIKNALNNILTTNHIASEKIFTDTSESIEGVGCANNIMPSKRRKYDESSIEKALRELETNGSSYRKVAEMYGLPKSTIEFKKKHLGQDISLHLVPLLYLHLRTKIPFFISYIVIIFNILFLPEVDI
ncbi:hypothetical protein JTB14_006780 [Gonioctena quinquepunctata]|nr:hypothetical protein JTB14_006780 [Gonioctena quinquepunctata]